MFYETEVFGGRFLRGRFFGRQVFLFLAVVGMALATTFTTYASALSNTGQSQKVEAPVNIAILIQDDLISSVGNEIRVTADFIRSLPKGSRVMVGYITAGSLQVRQPFTTDLDSAARSLRIPVSSTSASPYNPYVEVLEALRHFDSHWSGRNALLLISDGLDVSRGFDSSSAANTLDLERATNGANARNVAIYSFYAPSVGLTSRSRLAASYGQSSLNRISNETGGKAFFQGMTGFVTFDPYFTQLRRALNERS
jgi:hypothetical protein